ncbi:protein DpdF [Coraliomargarita sp. SDUM461003]|uniref:DNA 3'-5' helicase n=1 Tax=Thalassobacterium maritimum TaxID=3041265 RepID=A0ABU1AR81_9BACT|nr:protein DpdF [Coraliomargarita sp. SDUM461003]MDQ8206668.1 protein DpdF [Coraliomargarita sp. SDUM461003]
MSFEIISQILRNWPDQVVPSEAFEGHHCERLRIALKALQEESALVGDVDLAGLIRFVLRCESVSRGVIARLWVPIELPWPSRGIWESHGCSIGTSPKMGFQIVEADDWSPSWLDHPNPSPFHLVEEGKPVRLEKKVPCDPAVTDRFGITEYLSCAQRDVIRAVALSKQDSINVVVLPTGSGKSLVGLSAALFGPDLGVSIVVVPTIALAYDQMHEAKKHCDGLCVDAWHSNLSAADKKAIKERIRSGQQRILYASPESVVGTLSTSLAVAAQSGLIRAFIVDEAHMISQWGNGFRPEFQSMAGLWRQIRSICPEGRSFRTVLMTATLTDEAFESIATFYGPRENIDVLASVHLRPEPQYFLRHCMSLNEQTERVLETLKHGPRPVILYTTERSLADRWYTRLKDEGYKRVARVHGNTTGPLREQAIQQWRDNEVDIMVATSAFGLGMDKGDIRLVIHACVPETIDRFYQEIGRGGRDGYSTVSMLLWTDRDSKTAHGISTPSVITEELALERWKSLFDRKPERWIEDDVFLADLRSLRPGKSWDSELNKEWNLKTILLLERSGALEIISRPVPEFLQVDGESDESFKQKTEAGLETYWSTCPIRLKRNDTLDPDFWNTVIANSRTKTLDYARINWTRMSQVLKGTEEITAILCKLYQVATVGIDVDVGQNGYPVYPPKGLGWKVSQTLESIFETRSTKLLLVTYPPGIEESRLVDLMIRLVGQGIREVVVPSALRTDVFWTKAFVQLHQKAQPERFVCIRDLGEEDRIGAGGWPLACLTILDASFVGSIFPEELFLVERPLHIILLPEGLQDSRHPGRLIGDVQPPAVVRLSLFRNQLEL